VSLKHFTTSLLLPMNFGNDIWISSLCSVVLGFNGEAFALGYGGWHVLWDSCQHLCYLSYSIFEIDSLSIFFCILQDFFLSRRKVEILMPVD
jgi:hypothetical protein